MKHKRKIDMADEISVFNVGGYISSSTRFDAMSSCDWGFRSEAMKTYHDTEWSIPLHDDRKQFEFLKIEAMQCGLS